MKKNLFLSRKIKILLLCTILSVHLFAQFVEPKFEHITIKDGLPSSTINDILQDRQGYLWFACIGGLTKYDGYSMKTYSLESENLSSLTSSSVAAIYEDRFGDIWLITPDGLFHFDRQKEIFTHYVKKPIDPASINSTIISCIYEDWKGNFWVGIDKGLNLLNRQNNHFQRYDFQDSAYTQEVYSYLLSQKNKGKTIESIINVGDNAKLTKTFIIKKRKPVIVVIMGEGLVDYGWLENEKGKLILQYDYKKSAYAGGREDNRVQIIKDTLDAGVYRMHYVSNYSHSYKKWSGDPPNFSEFWGIQVFPDDNKFFELPKEKTNIYFDWISIIGDSSDNVLYLGTTAGLFTFDIDRRTFNRLFTKIDTLGFQPNWLTINKASNGLIWVVLEGGLASLNPKTNEIRLHKLNKSSIDFSEISTSTYIEEPGGLIWIGFLNGSLVCFDPLIDQFQVYRNDPYDKYSLLLSSPWGILTIFKDRSNILWISSADFGLNKWNPNKANFNSYQYNIDKSKSLGHNLVMSMIEDKSGIIWIGTYGGGLVKYDRLNNTFFRYINDPHNSKSISDNYVVSICEDPIEDGVLWLGTKNGGLNKFFYKINEFISYLNHESVSFILPEGEDILWICSFGSGLYKFNRKTEEFIHYEHNPEDLSSINCNFVLLCYKDSRRTLWIGNAEKGISRYYDSSETFRSYTMHSKGFLPYGINSIHENKEGNLWVGGFGNGLYLFDREKEQFVINLTQEEGLANNAVMSILEDDNGILWISTYNGLSRFDPATKSFRNYYEENGLSNNKFIFRAAFKSRTGELFFGGENGFTWFHPENIKDDPVPPKITISQLSLFNRPDEKLEIDGIISEMEEIKLSYDQNYLRFDYVGLHFAEPSKNEYKYFLENFDEDWVEAGTQRNAVYTNLDPGEYIFRVKAANRDGIWSEKDASIKIIILPPWWATTWAYLLYALIILSIIYFTWKLQLKRIRIKHSYEMTKFEAEKMHEVDELKNRFFANISHEFRTPLTLILGLAKKIIEKSKEQSSKEDAGVIRRNAKRLHGLVNQLLDLSKLESGNMLLQTSPLNIIPLLKGLVLSFASFAERKRITLKFNSNEKEIVVFIDKDKIEKIITNLLSNAFKFTPLGGRIEFSVEKSDNNIKMIISDTGIGISPERIAKIFDRFYQVDSSHTREQEGTGLGLALTKELIELHKGKIEVESSEGKGSTFTVTLPLGKDHLRSEEIVEDKFEEQKIEFEGVEFSSDYEEHKVKQNIKLVKDVDLSADKPEKLLLLIVEDNADVRNYIKGDLENEYMILEAPNGEEGLNHAIKQIPDLIISDVMMPKMDGFELCEKLKTDERTSHIPIILLTAKATEKDKIIGFETGADDYIMKPFDNIILKTRIKNLIQQRERLREHFIKEGIFQVDDTNVRAIDKIFLKKALDVINKHISDETFSVDLFSEEIAMSRSQLRRKLVALVGKAPGDLIRTIRLTKAAKLLQQNFGNISEIAAEVGFNNPANFAHSFKTYFGVSPSEYLNSEKA
jgi:signal transduction histidine kinase/ligand-binding sensor domain-containing protein/AraC-like DNA-binding protein